MVCHRWTEPCHYTWCRHSLVGHQLIKDAAASLVDSELAQRALGGVVANTSTTNSAGVLARYLEDMKANIGDWELGLFHVGREFFTFHTSLRHIELGDALLLGVRVEHQVISIKKLSRHNSRKGASSTRVKNSRLRTVPRCTSQTFHCTDHWPHTNPGVGVHAWMTRRAHSSAPRLLKAHHRTFPDPRSKDVSRFTKAKLSGLLTKIF